MLLTLMSLSRAFGGVYAVRDVNVAVQEKELRGIIGPNGAGKSTLFNLIGGQLQPSRGSIELDGARVDRLPVHKRARIGIAVVFQGARLFPGMTVLENVMVGATPITRAGAIAATLRLPSQRNEERQIRNQASKALARVGLLDWAREDAESLPLGQQRRVQVARALAGQPRLLLLDEPASGLRTSERDDLSTLIADLRAEGITIMLVEHDVAMVMRLADCVTVLDLGEVIAEGTPDEVSQDQNVIDAYLGTAHADAE